MVKDASQKKAHAIFELGSRVCAHYFVFLERDGLNKEKRESFEVSWRHKLW